MQQTRPVIIYISVWLSASRNPCKVETDLLFFQPLPLHRCAEDGHRTADILFSFSVEFSLIVLISFLFFPFFLAFYFCSVVFLLVFSPLLAITQVLVNRRVMPYPATHSWRQWKDRFRQALFLSLMCSAYALAFVSHNFCENVCKLTVLPCSW